MPKKVNFREISEFDSPQHSVGYLLWQTSTRWRYRLEQVLNDLGITHPQFVVLASIGWLTRGGEDVSQKEVGKMAALDPNTTSQVVRALEQKKMVLRKKSLDARVKNPTLTEKGAEVLRVSLPEVEREDESYFAPLNQKEQDQLLKLFIKLNSSNYSI